jgi:dinuclear metal center YbgI/SA1388 family protein
MDCRQISQYLDGLLDIHSIRDFPKALNGLQVENRIPIRKVGLAVDACRATIEMARDADCQMLFVHHGLFWSGLVPVRGPQYDRLAALIQADMALYSAHLPLDVHPMLGNNRQLADKIGLEQMEAFAEYEGQPIGLKGRVTRQPAEDLAKKLSDRLGAEVKCIGQGEVETVGLVTGGAGDMLHDAIEHGLDCYITGEGAAHLYHEATEGGCVLLLAGHYATETGGVQAVGDHLQEQFGLETVFLDYPTGL